MNNKFIIVTVNNSQIYANKYEYCIHSTVIPYDKNNDLVIRYKNDTVYFEIDPHYIDNKGVHHRGIGENIIISEKV